MNHETLFARASDLISQADGLIIGAGAGMGVDSGLPDFRGDEGFWRAYPALGRQGLDFQSIASPQAFESQLQRRDLAHRQPAPAGGRNRVPVARRTAPLPPLRRAGAAQHIDV